jgi:hypothetical protein
MDIWIMIVLIILVVGYFVYLAITKQWAKLRAAAYALMLSAEKIYEKNEGPRKFEVVLRELYDIMPVWLSVILTEEKIRKTLQEWYELAKEYIGGGYD